MLRVLHLFAGAGGGILADQLLGHTTVGAVELDQFCRDVLEERQADGSLSTFPIHDDITTFDGRPWRGRVDVVAGGFPCQDISVCGKREGLEGNRSGLWFEMRRVVREVEPRYVFVENVPGLLVRGMDRVLADLADLGFDAEWEVLSAADCGAPHLRRRVWILAAHPYRHPVRLEQQRATRRRVDVQAGRQAEPSGDRADDPDADCRRREELGQPEPRGICGTPGRQPDRLRTVRGLKHAEAAADAGGPGLPAPEQGRPERAGPPRSYKEWQATAERGWWRAEPDVGRVAHGVAARVVRLRALGNGQVPACAAAAWRLLMNRLEKS